MRETHADEDECAWCGEPSDTDICARCQERYEQETAQA
jgi:hypothetical protein